MHKMHKMQCKPVASNRWSEPWRVWCNTSVLQGLKSGQITLRPVLCGL